MARGGARKGSGRPATGPSTSVVRVPNEYKEYVQKLPDLIDAIQFWTEEVGEKDSPRYYWARQILADLNRILR